jgi:hypothetical protein
MKKSYFLKKNALKYRITLQVLALSTILIFLLSNCSALNRNSASNNEVVSFPTPTQAGQTPSLVLPRVPQENRSRTPTPVTPTVIPSLTNTITSTLSDVEWYERYMVIDTTQNPPVISTVSAPGKDYLYKNAVVTFSQLGNPPGELRYLNMDDLSDNSPSNSDLLIKVMTGTAGTFYDLYPVNFARYYFSGKSYMNYDSCISEFPADSNYANSDDQSLEIVTSKPYCVLTNEGRIGIIYAVKDSMMRNDQGDINLSLVVIVYSKKAVQIFTPAPTITPGPSPTPTGWYSGANLTSEQGKVLEDQITKFQKALSAKDMETLPDFFDFPFSITKNDGDLIQIYSKEDFYSIFDELFPDSFITEISQASIGNNFMSSRSGIYINLNDARIWFGTNGKINFIDYWGQ